MDVFGPKTHTPPDVEMGRRYFTLEQANRAVVLVRRILADVLDRYQRVLDEQEMLDVYQRKGPAEKARATQGRIIRLVERLQSLSDELVEIGVEMKDWAGGIVDFPAWVDGREIQYCWQYGEDQILYWHEIDDGCAGRRSIEALHVAS
ncbi:MAG: DUF2203 domain-containing protein [Planctomycetota bacterium]